MLDITNRNNILLKICFDGYDLLRNEMGQQLVPSHFYPIVKHSYSNNYEGREEFIEYCYQNYLKSNIEGYIPDDIIGKYKVGIYSLKNAFDENNPWCNREYVLFNQNILKLIFALYPPLDKELLFYVCPTENGIGFRVVDTNKVENAFKWLFMSGNNLIYGNPDKEKECYVVEGFRDYVALNEIGYNVIGLGSVDISKTQKEYIDTLNPILLLDNDNFGLQKSLMYKKLGFRVATLTGTKYKDAYDTWINNIPLNIVEIE